MDARIIVEPLSFKLWNSTENDIKLPRVLKNKTSLKVCRIKEVKYVAQITKNLVKIHRYLIDDTYLKLDRLKDCKSHGKPN